MDIEKFNQFIKILNEAYDNPVNINWIKNSNSEFDGEFYVDDIKYIIECSEWDNNIWSYKFSRIENNEKIMHIAEDPVRKMRVLSTIRVGMVDLVNYKNPSGLIINVTDGSRGRDYLWGRFSKEISEKFNYHLRNQQIMGYSSFFLWKDTITFEMVNKSFNKMLMLFQNQ